MEKSSARICLVLIGLLTVVLAEQCYEVPAGDFYGRPFVDNTRLIKTAKTIRVEVVIDKNASEYLIPPGKNTPMCMGSWNKLYGCSRCFGSPHHRNSDRFVWRRALSCLKNEGDSTSVIPDCPDANKIDIAAYAYNKGLKPYQHIGTLLKKFNTKVEVDVPFQYEITIEDTETIYNLYDASGSLLETQVVEHSKCFWPQVGYMLGWYFGGVCPAPQEVSACYNSE